MQSFLPLKKIIPLIVFSILSTVLMATPSKTIENSYIDHMHKKISNKIIEWSDILDNNISSWLENDNETCCALESPNTANTNIEDIDAFFQNERYLNETRDIYVRLRIRNEFYSRQSNKINVRISARLPFDKCKKQWNIFLEDVSSNKSEIKKTDTSGGGVGINYFREGKFGIKGNYSLGLQGSDPYVRARYRLPMKFDIWEIEPVQTFKYSTKYYFEEETNIYFDRFFDKNNLLRIQLHRETASTINGTDYGLTLQYFWNLEENGKLEFTQSFFGNTHYNDYYEFDKKYSGINNYVSSISWRQNIWRDWFYYEIKPSVNFHKDYAYKASYSIRFNFDFYFGNFNK